MIIGIGTDLMEVARMRRVFNEQSVRLEKRILSEEEQKRAKEITDLKQRMLFLSKRFAAKEAFTKALGVGIGETISFHDITVYNDAAGKPHITLSPKGEKALADKGGKVIHLTLSDEAEYAVAFVVIEG